MYPRGGRVGSLALATHHRTSGSARTAPRQRCFDPAGAPFAFGRTWPSPGRQTGLAQNAGSIHDWVVRRVETARISLTHTPRFRLAPCVGQNGARPDIGRFCTGSTLSARWKVGSGFPADQCVSEAMPLLGEFTQVSRRCSACATPTFREDGRCLPPPLKNHTRRNQPVCEPGA